MEGIAFRLFYVVFQKGESLDSVGSAANKTCGLHAVKGDGLCRCGGGERVSAVFGFEEGEG